MQMDEKIAAAAENWTCRGKGEMQQLIIASQRYHGFLYQTIIGPMYVKDVTAMRTACNSCSLTKLFKILHNYCQLLIFCEKYTTSKRNL